MSDPEQHLETLVSINRALLDAKDGERNVVLATRDQYLRTNPEAQKMFGTALMAVLSERRQEEAND